MAVNWREELLTRRRQQPFEPFRVTLINGDAYEVFDPFEFLVGDIALVLPVHDKLDPDRDYPTFHDVGQVVRIEPIDPRPSDVGPR